MVFKVTIAEGSPFTLHNIPFGVISTEADPQPRCATAIGGFALDLPLYWKEVSASKIEGIAASSERLHRIFAEVNIHVFIK